MDLLDSKLYELLGEDGFTRLVAAFYRRVPDDDILAPLYPPADLAGAEARLREFLIMRFGGPEHYSQKRGHPRLRMRHSRFRVDRAARDRWVHVMDQALAESQFGPEPTILLRRFFDDAATFLINQPG